MNKLSMAMELHYNIYHYSKKTYKEMLEDLGWENEMSLFAFRRFYLNVSDYEKKNNTYCNEMKILYYLNRHCFENGYIQSNVIIKVLGFSEDENSKRTIRRYINDIDKAGYKIETKKGIYGGYKLVEYNKYLF